MSAQDEADRKLGRAVAEMLSLEVGDTWQIHEFVKHHDRLMIQKVSGGTNNE